MVFLCIACIVLSSIALHGIAFHGIAWHCIAFDYLLWYCMVLHRLHGVVQLIWRAGELPRSASSHFCTFWPKNGSQPHISPRLRCFNRKITQKLCATCITGHLFWLVISPSCCSRQGPPLWNWGNFDHFNPLQTTLNVIWLKKVVPNLPFTYLGKVKKNWQLFPLLFFGESQKYERGGVCRPPPRIQ